MTGLLPWQSWLVAGCVLLALLALEYSFRAWRKANPDTSRFYLEASLIADGADGSPPEYRARFKRDGKNAIFYIEYSWSARGWTQPRKIKALVVERFAAGEVVSFPIVQKMADDSWRFGQPDETDVKNGLRRDFVGPNFHYRGRVTLLTDDDISQHCYFILWTGPSLDTPPHARGEHLFSHMFEWEGKTPPNVAYKSLFK